MANRGGPSVQKRLRERARQQKQQEKLQEKASRRADAKERKEAAGPRLPGALDPEIAAIRPGQQPLPIEWQDREDLEEQEEQAEE